MITLVLSVAELDVLEHLEARQELERISRLGEVSSTERNATATLEAEQPGLFATGAVVHLKWF